MKEIREKSISLISKADSLINELKLLSAIQNPYLTDEYVRKIVKYLDEIDEAMDKIPKQIS